MWSCCKTTYYSETQIHFLRVVITPLTGKFVLKPKKSATFGHMLLNDRKTKSDSFSILLKENKDKTLTLLQDTREWSKLRDTVDWGRKWLIDFNAAKTQLVLFDQSNNTGSVLKEKSSFKAGIDFPF